MIVSAIIFKSLFLIPTIIIGLISSYSDIKYGKIKNIYLKWGFLYIIFLYFVLASYSYFVIYQIDNLKYLIRLLFNGLIAFIIGYLLWYFNLWSAGDAKLFTLYSLLIPLEVYSNNYIVYFPSFIILINTFTIIIAFLLSVITIKTIYELFIFIVKRNKINISQIFKNIKYFIIVRIQLKNYKNILVKIFNFLILPANLLIILQIFKNKIQIIFSALLINSYLGYFLLLLLYIFLFRIITKNKIYRIIIIIVGSGLCLYLLISQQTIILFSVIKSTLLMILLFNIFIQPINWYLEYKDIEAIRVHDLRPGVFLTQKSIMEIQNKLNSDAKFNIKELSFSDGLSRKQIEIIKDIFRDDPQKILTIYKTFPFAPFLFLAFIVTLITRSSILQLFSYLFNN